MRVPPVFADESRHSQGRPTGHEMKIRALIPTIIALAILVGGPFSYGPICGSDPQRGLTCYCCSGTGMNCTMISCAGCGGSHGSAAVDRWSPEMVPESFELLSAAAFAYRGKERSLLPEMAYLEVPHKPPNRA